MRNVKTTKTAKSCGGTRKTEKDCGDKRCKGTKNCK